MGPKGRMKRGREIRNENPPECFDGGVLTRERFFAHRNKKTCHRRMQHQKGRVQSKEHAEQVASEKPSGEPITRCSKKTSGRNERNIFHLVVESIFILGRH